MTHFGFVANGGHAGADMQGAGMQALSATGRNVPDSDLGCCERKAKTTSSGLAFAAGGEGGQRFVERISQPADQPNRSIRSWPIIEVAFAICSAVNAVSHSFSEPTR